MIMTKRGGMINYVTNIYIGANPQKQALNFNYAIGRPIAKGEKTMLELNVTNEEKVLVTCNPVTPAGNAVELDGPISVTVQNGDGSFEIQADGKSVFLISGVLPGDTTFIVEGDADLGSGIESISDVILLHVAGAKAASFGLSAGTPVLK
jgi:hypothetical protein